jgi:hypothetical protein
MPLDADPTRIAATITFGDGGNAGAFLREGWTAPERGFTWSVGPRSVLSVPYNAGEGMLTLEMRASPMRALPRLISQELTVVVNGTAYGTDKLGEDSVLAFPLSGIASGVAGCAEIELRHPGAAAPADYIDTDDRRCLAICMRSLRLLWLPREPAFTPRHRPRLMVPGPGYQEEIVRGCTALAPLDLMQQFLSLGHNCEFGLVQKHLGVTAASLLRFGGTDPHDILAGLECAFDGIDDPGQISLFREDNKGEQQYWVRCEKYGMQFHSFIPVASTTEREMHAQMARYLGFLRRQFEASMREGRFIFVLHHIACASPAQVRPFLRALRQWGPGALLFVTPDTAEIGSVDQVEANLFHGHVDFLMTQEKPDVINAPAWLSICANTYRMWRETGGGQD